MQALRQLRQRPCPSAGLHSAASARLSQAKALLEQLHGVSRWENVSEAQLQLLETSALSLLRSLASSLQRVSAALLLYPLQPCPQPMSSSCFSA